MILVEGPKRPAITEYNRWVYQGSGFKMSVYAGEKSVSYLFHKGPHAKSQAILCALVLEPLGAEVRATRKTQIGREVRMPRG